MRGGVGWSGVRGEVGDGEQGGRKGERWKEERVTRWGDGSITKL